MECMFTAQGPSVFHAIEVAVVQFAQVHLVSEEVGTGHVSSKSADVAPLTLYCFFTMAVSRVLDHFSRYKQEGREI